MALLTVQDAVLGGLNKTTVPASAGGDTFVNDGNTSLHVKNGSGASITVTIVAVGACNHGVTHNVVVTVPAGADSVIGKFDPTRFNNASGQVSVTYSAVTSVTVAVVKG